MRAEYLAGQQRDIALANEQRALEAKSAESTARAAEQEARAAETTQREIAEQQRGEAEQQRDEAQRLQKEAIARNVQLERMSEEQRRALYAADMNLVRLEAMRGNLRRTREILYAQLPIDRPDLRGMEWNYWYHYLTQAKVLRTLNDLNTAPDPIPPLLLPGAKIIATRSAQATKIGRHGQWSSSPNIE